MFKFRSAKSLSLKTMNDRISKAEACLDEEIQKVSLTGAEKLDVPVNYKGLNIREFNLLIERYRKGGYYYTFTATSDKSPNFITLSWSEEEPYVVDDSHSRLSFSVTDKKTAIASTY